MFFILFQHIDSLDCDDDNVHDNNDTSHLHCIFQSTVRYIILFDSKNAPEMIMTALYTAEPPTAHNSSSAAYRLCHRHSMESYCPKFWCSGKSPSSKPSCLCFSAPNCKAADLILILTLDLFFQTRPGRLLLGPALLQNSNFGSTLLCALKPGVITTHSQL